MLFNSPLFAVFFLAVFAAYWTVRARVAQNVLLLLASYLFYGAWSWKFLALLIASTVFDFCCGLLLERTGDQSRKRLIVAASVIANLTLLAIFKYLGFFVAEAADALRLLGFQANLPALEIILPIGISFYTFQTIGYVVDVYRGKVPASHNLLEYSLYVAFFPQLVAGPIERATHLLPQFRKSRVFDRYAFESGLQLMVWGLFKKVVIADNLAPYVNAVYGSPEQYSGAALTTATVFFAFQIYCDFSGYTDTARGTARTLGFELMQNFDHPYTSRTPVEFWRRWHISLSQWFQDYLYFPLAMRYMRRGGWASKYKAHIISMGLIGFWHGASWTFVVFGLYWGVSIALYLYFAERRAAAMSSAHAVQRVPPGVRKGVCIALMFVIVCVGWVFFRAESLAQAWYVLSHLFSATGITTVLRVDVPEAWLLWLLIGGLLTVEWVQRNRQALLDRWGPASAPAFAWRYALLVAVVFSYIISLRGEAEPFIYFQF